MSNASLTPTDGWYADPMGTAQLRWWDGFTWTQQTTPASGAEPRAHVTPIAPEPTAPEPTTPVTAPVPPAAAVADGPGIYVPRNSVFKMAEAVDGQAYLPEWSGIVEISDEVALSGVPVQLALTATPSDGPPIPVSAEAFPILGFVPEPVAAPAPPAPAWHVETPLAKPIDQLFPLAGPAAGVPVAAVPVAPIPATLPVPPAAPAFSIAVAPVPEPVADPTPATPTLSAKVFPPTAPESPLSVALPPSGVLFPGLVPTAPEPEPEPESAPVSIPRLAAVPDLVEIPEPLAEVPLAVAPDIPEPVAPQPIQQQPLAPEPELYAGPALVAAPVSAPVAELSSMASIAASTSAPAATKTAWPAEGTYQPHPGSYVPFDPNAVHVQESLPLIAFSSRDPYNPASTSRPALRSYGSAPVGPSGSTYTPALAIILLTPLLIAGGYALLFQLTLINVGLAPNLAVTGLIVGLFFVGIGAAQFDRNTLAKRGYFDLASPFWILLSPLFYLGVRASRVHSQGSGGIRAVFLWFGSWAGAAVILTFSTFAALTAATPERIAQTEQLVAQSFVADKVVPTVVCPTVPIFAPGTVFTCTVTAGSTVSAVQVTVTDWTGSESYKLVATTAPATPTAPTPLGLPPVQPHRLASV